MKELCWVMGVLWLCASCSSSSIETIVIRGSDTEVNLVLSLAEIYMERHPATSIAVTGGGSGTGIAALLNGKTDIANSSRDFKSAEKKLARDRAVEVIPIIFAVDALCFIVHESLPIDSLSLSQIRSIYRGTVDNWATLGGPDLPISLYGRQANSGTYTFIQTEILRGDYVGSMKQMNGSSQIVEGIRHDPAGIGYVGIGYVSEQEGKIVEGVKVISVKDEQQPSAISPVERANILSGDYPVTRPLYQFVNGSPSGLLKHFLLYELSSEGQAIIGESGYFPITDHHQSINQQYLAHE